MTDFKLVRRDTCAMCQTNQKELEALLDVEKAARNIRWRMLTHIDVHGHENLEDKFKKLDKARQG